MLEAQLHRQDKTDTTVPFGIRALESGIRVEGVWVSRPGSPVTLLDSPKSVASSYNGDSGASSKFSSGQESFCAMPRLELPEPLHRIPPSPWVPPTSSFTLEKRPFNGKPLSTGTGSFDAPWSENRRHSSTSATAMSTHQLPPLLNAAALDALEGRARRSVDITDNGPPPDYYSDSEDESDHDWEKLQLIHPALRTARLPAPPVVDPRSNLDLLQSHRMSHVAETGELKPRTRRYGRNNTWIGFSGGNDSNNSLPTATNSSEFAHPLTPPDSPGSLYLPKTSASSLPSFPTNSSESTILEPRTPPSPQSTFSKKGKPTPIIVSASPAMDDDYFESTFQHFKRFGFDSAPVSPSSPRSRKSEDRQLVMTAQNYQRACQVLRKVNSRFEILKPGTLNEMESQKSETGIEPPLPKKEKKEKKQLRKLQKKRVSMPNRSFTLFSAVRVGENPIS